MTSHPGDRDLRWMAEALCLARRGEGYTRPNPPVGAVIVRDGKVIACGYHHRAGGPHAEIHALRQAGRLARGATLYVTLEPCCTWGRTPPCTDAIREAGIRRVVTAMRDPNPHHRGRGIARLRKAGIQVTEGVAAQEAQGLVAPFARWITTRRPYLTLKLALTLDGRIADATGRSRWITGVASRRMVQQLRRRCDAVLVGVGTVLADDPSLRPVGARGWNGVRIIVDSRGRTPLSARVLTDGAASQTAIATTRRCPARRIRDLSATGARVWILPESGGRVSLQALSRLLGRQELLHVLCEGGGELAAALIRSHLVDEFLFFLAPRIIGGRDAIPAVGGPGWSLATAPHLRITECRRSGGDCLIRAVPGGVKCSPV